MVQYIDDLEVGAQAAAYADDTYLMSVTTRVLAVGRDDGDGPWVAVERNIFHPQGGGQPADRGRLGECEVAPQRHPGTGLVVLRAPEAHRDGLARLAEGEPVVAHVDAGTRLLHAALHTAGHLVEAAGRTLGWVHAGNNHFPGQARIEFAPPPDGLGDPEAREEAAERLRAWVAEAVSRDHPVTAEHDGQGRRVVRIGDLHAAPCGGTHVRSLADLEELLIPAVKVKKGRVKVAYTASHGPLR
ncbi:alanyl-tRNA editing protein [Streptomyces capparidis]